MRAHSKDRMTVPCPGCGRPRDIAIQTYLNNHKRVGPCRECRDGQIVRGEPAAVNGCRLHPTRGPSRCAKGATCDHYGNCLDVAAKRDWQGWRTSA